MNAGKYLTYSDTKKQSLAVFGQFGEKVWIPNAKENAKLPHRNAEELQNVGLGKVLVMVAMGESLEAEIDNLKKYRDRIDIMCCDKGFVPLMERGIKPDYVMICDANIPARHFETHIHQTKGIKLIATPYANNLWTKSWMGDRYFYINKDAIRSETIFQKIMGEDKRIIPAASNVSNAMVVFMLGTDEKKRINWAGYERYLLVGYDYSWRPLGNYYAWNNPLPKRNYMHHLTLLDINKDIVFTSHNLNFSSRWMKDYLQYHELPIVNCSERGLLISRYRAKLGDQLSMITPDGRISKNIREAYKILQTVTLAQKQANQFFDSAREEIWR